MIKELARELFLEVIDELAEHASKDVIEDFEMVTVCKLVSDETCDELAR
jgi:hypothetical protein